MQNLPNVSLVFGETNQKSTFQALDLIDYKKALAGLDKVVIKVNFIVKNAYLDNSLDTNPSIVEAIIIKLKETNIKHIYVAESSDTVNNVTVDFQATGIKDICNKHGVECINLSDYKKGVKKTVPNPTKLKTISFPKLITESAIISVSTVDLYGMKNMFGLIHDKNKAKYYAKGIDSVVIDINSIKKPVLTVIGGFVGFGEDSNIKLTLPDLIVAGTDVVATDATACKVLGYDPNKIELIRRASEKGLGNLNAKIIGHPIDEAAKKIAEARAKILPAQFELYQKSKNSLEEEKTTA